MKVVTLLSALFLAGSMSVMAAPAPVLKANDSLNLLVENEDEEDANLAAYEEDIATVNELIMAFQEINDKITTEFPDGENQETSHEIYTKLMEMYNAIQEALEAAAETGEYVSPLTGSEYVELFEAMHAYLQQAEAMQNYANDIETINELANTFQEMNDLIDAEYPEGVNELTAAEIYAKIMAMYEAVNAALEQAAETGIYQSPLGAEHVEIFDAMQAYLQQAEAMQNYANDIETINELANAFQEMNDLIDAEYPEGVNELTAAEIYAKIMAMYEAVNAALEQADETGIYQSPLGHEYVEIFDAMQAYLQQAEAMQNYANDIETINELANAFQEMNELIETEYPEGVNEYTAADIYAKIMAMYEAVNAALEAADETGIYQSPLGHEYVEIFDAMQAYLQQAEIAQLYSNDIDALQTLIMDFNDIMDYVNSEYPTFVDEETEAEIYAMIWNLYSAIENALVEADENGVYMSPVTEEAIQEIQIALEDYESAVEDKFYAALEAILPYVEADEDMLNDLYDQIEYVVDVYPDTYNQETYDEIMAAWDEMAERLYETFYEALATGEYNSPFSEEEIADLQTRINDFLDDAKSPSGINGVEVAGSAKYYDINGIEVANPVAGKVYIRVINGKATKVIM